MNTGPPLPEIFVPLPANEVYNGEKEHQASEPE
jgi:hypothetical protein